MVSNFSQDNRIEVPRNKEFRVEASEERKYKIKVCSGLAELNGAELVGDTWYTFTNCKCSIFTFTGCSLEVDGECDLSYVSERSLFPKTYDVFNSLQHKETVLVLGEGCTTLSLTLCNYFVRDHRQIIFTEIDPSKGNIFPGTLSTSKVSGLSFGSFKYTAPYCLFYGSKLIENTELYELQMKLLSEQCQKMMEDEDSLAANVILAPYTEHKMLEKTIENFGVSRIIVSRNERLFHRIKQNLPSNKIKMDFIQNNGYIEENKVQKSIKRYFEGLDLQMVNNNMVLKSVFTPSKVLLGKAGSFTTVKIGEEFVAPETALPLGASRTVGIVGAEEVDLVANSVLAISSATEKEDVATSPVMGFLVCLDGGTGKVLSAQPTLPKLSFLIQGTLKYF